MKFLLAYALFAALTVSASAQGKSELDNPTVPIAPGTVPQPASAVLDSMGIPGATDAAPEGSPVSSVRVGSTLRVGSVVSMKLLTSVDSGGFKNGDAVHGTLTAPVKTSAGVTLAAGTRVDGTIVSAAKAGTVQSAGILSMQLTRVGPVPVVTDVVDFNGQEGHKDVADARPAKGTEAVAKAGSMLEFHVMENGPVPGIVPGVRLDNTNGGAQNAARGQGSAPAPLPSTGQPNTGPGVNQTPINGGSQPTQTAAPATGPGR